MIWLRLVALGLSLGAAWWLGSLVAARLLGAPSRLSRAALGSGVGLVALGLPLLWLPRVLPVGSALLLTGGLCALGVLVLRRRPAPNVCADDLAFVAGFLVVGALAYLSALAFWFEGTAGGGDVATLYLHSGLATGIARGNFPVINPFEPDFALQYRVTLHTLAAGVIDLLDAPTRDVMPHVVAATAVVAIASVYGALAALVRPGWALGGAALSYAWGPLYWLLTAPAIRERGLGDVLGVIVQAPDTIAWSGLLLGGPFTMPTHNPTVVHGVIVAVVTVVALGRAIAGGGVGSWIVGLAVLTYLGASNEFLVVTVPAGLAAALWLGRSFRPRPAAARTLTLIGAAGLALLLNQTTSGVLAGVLGGDPDLGRLRPGFNTAHLGQLPSWGYNSDGPWSAWPDVGFHDVPILGLEFLVDGGLLFWLLAATLLWVVLRRGRSHAAPWALVAAANVAIALGVRLEQSPADLYRVLHAGLTLAVPAMAIAASEAVAGLPRGRRLATVIAAALGLLLSGAFLVSTIAWPRMVAQAQIAPTVLPDGVSEFLTGQTDVRDRLLVVHGAKTAYLLYDGRSPRTTAYISADTGQFIPYGYHHLSQADAYAERYGLAQRELPDPELISLGIRFVLVEPAQLDSIQRAEIARKLVDGRFRVVYRDPDGAALIYAYAAPR
jgi:hypothetical protein